MNTYTDGKLTFRKSKDGSFFSVRSAEKNVRIADIPSADDAFESISQRDNKSTSRERDTISTLRVLNNKIRKTAA